MRQALIKIVQKWETNCNKILHASMIPRNGSDFASLLKATSCPVQALFLFNLSVCSFVVYNQRLNSHLIGPESYQSLHFMWIIVKFILVKFTDFSLFDNFGFMYVDFHFQFSILPFFYLLIVFYLFSPFWLFLPFDHSTFWLFYLLIVLPFVVLPFVILPSVILPFVILPFVGVPYHIQYI